jgi:Fe2+ or Zn2+ uptake regulation protein
MSSQDGGLYELAEHLTEHHHHLVCSTCGTVRDVVVPDALERDLDSALTKLAKREGFALDHHRLDLIGRCASCQ